MPTFRWTQFPIKNFADWLDLVAFVQSSQLKQQHKIKLAVTFFAYFIIVLSTIFYKSFKPGPQLGKEATGHPPEIIKTISKLFSYEHIGVRGGGSGGMRPPPRSWKIQGKLCFQGKQNLLKNPEWLKISQHSEKFQGNSVFQDKRKLLKNPEW